MKITDKEFQIQAKGKKYVIISKLVDNRWLGVPNTRVTNTYKLYEIGDWSESKKGRTEFVDMNYDWMLEVINTDILDCNIEFI
jgi:hypothetical protein